MSSDKTNPKDAAFPTFAEATTDRSGDDDKLVFSGFDGVSKREYFAAKALQGLLTNNEGPNMAAKAAVQAADALIKELIQPRVPVPRIRVYRVFVMKRSCRWGILTVSYAFSFVRKPTC